MAKDESDKNGKREAQALREEARAAFERGDYRQARSLSARVVAMGTDSDAGRKAAQLHQQLRVEPMALYLGAGALVLYAATWAFSLW